jgi:hypothetical protein
MSRDKLKQLAGSVCGWLLLLNMIYQIYSKFVNEH